MQMTLEELNMNEKRNGSIDQDGEFIIKTRRRRLESN